MSELWLRVIGLPADQRSHARVVHVVRAQVEPPQTASLPDRLCKNSHACRSEVSKRRVAVANQHLETRWLRAGAHLTPHHLHRRGRSKTPCQARAPTQAPAARARARAAAAAGEGGPQPVRPANARPPDTETVDTSVGAVDTRAQASGGPASAVLASFCEIFHPHPPPPPTTTTATYCCRAATSEARCSLLIQRPRASTSPQRALFLRFGVRRAAPLGTEGRAVASIDAGSRQPSQERALAP